MAKGSTTVTATPSKSGGARNARLSPDVTAARLAAVYAFDKNPAPEPGAATPETATLLAGLSAATKSLSRSLAAELDDVAGPDPYYDCFSDGTKGSKPSVASARCSALLNAPCPHINSDRWAKRGADRDATGFADALPYSQDSHMVTPRSTSRTRRMDGEDEGSRGRRGRTRAPRSGLGRRRTNTDASSSDDDDLLPPAYEDEDPQAELTR
ncbi:hypothetical protein PC128_g24650 [Phytophthora cactorum]|nr:hypothetical protein PC128_g24650 [Phytophthora cactorum]